MGCCGSQDGVSLKRVSRGDIADRPDVENMASITECCGALWDVKDKWAAIRTPITDSVDALGAAAEWDGGDVPGIAKGLIACICQDMKPGKEDFEGIVDITTEAPFIKFQPD